LEAFAKVQDRIAFAGEQSVHTDPGLFGEFFEAVPQELVSQEHFALFFG
jgi:hypothetical protein